MAHLELGKRPLASRWIVGVAAVAWLTLAAFGMWHELAERHQRRFAAALAERALSASGASPSLEELERLGLVGVEPLVALAASQREDVSSAAQQRVSRLLKTWEQTATESGDVDRFAFQSAILAAALDAHAHRFGPDGQRWASELAERLAIHCDQFPASHSWKILASCDRVLSRPLAPRPKRAVAIESIQAPAEVARPEPPAIAASSPLKPLGPTRSELSPSEPSPVPPAVAVSGRLLAELTLVETPSADARLEGPTSRANSLRPPLRHPEAAPAPARIDRGPVVDVPSPQEVRLRARSLRGLSNESLAAKTRADVPGEAAAAAKALRDRGFSEAMLRLTRELEALSPSERRDALQRAAELPPADARRLLRRFVADADPLVRLEALTILATTGDPKLDELARERAVEDADPRVAAFASELLRTR
jgi:hypothetical protein